MNKQKTALLLTAVMLLSALPSEALLAKETVAEVMKEAVDTAALETLDTPKKEEETDSEETVSVIRKSDDSTAQEETEKTEAQRAQIPKETIEIRTVEDFLSFADQCHLDAWSYNKTVELKGDINLSGYTMEPIPVFDGIFKGNGHTISAFGHTGSGYAAGLFRYVGKNGRIENLTLEGNVSSTDEKKCIGGLCGNNEGVITGCKFDGTVSGRTETGGIAGINQSSGVIENCVAKGRITGYYYTGGIVGKNHGNVVDCVNQANINDSSAWVEEDDQSSGLGWFKSVSSGGSARLQSGVDTGGIAGYSNGVIMSCSNSGTVGYEHTGYNIGGIAGRQSGLLTSSSNKGTVYGRKDVGGVVGQMEPYIKLSVSESVEEEIQKLHDLIDKTLDDMGTAKDALTADCDNLINYSDGALNRSHTMLSQISGFADSNIGAVNQIGERFQYVAGKLPAVLDPLSGSLTDIKAISEDIKKLNDDLHVIGQMEINGYDETDYRRLSLVTGVGGSLTADNSDPAEGARVSLMLQPDHGYTAGTVSARDANGNPVELSEDAAGAYSFTMPKENVAVSAVFSYQGAYLAASSAGGQVYVNENGSQISITAVPFAEYRLEGLSIGGIPLSADGTISFTVNKSDYPANGSPVPVYADFQRNSYEGNHDDTYTIQCAGGTGGRIIADMQQAEEGAQVRIISTQDMGYRLKKLTVKSGDSVIPVSGTDAGAYTFTMPAEDVAAEAEYEPVRFSMTSNAGGSASYAYTVSGNTIKMTVDPNEGYTLSGDPAVTGGNGNAVPVSRVKAGSFVYEFMLTSEQEPAKAYMEFVRQNQYTSIQSALDGIGASGEELTGSMERVAALVQEIRGIALNADGTVKDFGSLTEEQKDILLRDIIELSEQLSAAGRAASSILGNVSLIANVTGPYLSQTAENTHNDIEQAILHAQGVVDYLSQASGGVRGIVNYLNGQENIQFSGLGDEFDQNTNELYTQLQGISDSMKNLNSDLDQHSDVLNQDFRAVNDQLNVVLLLFIDRIDQLENPDVRTIYEDVSEEDIEETMQGKVSQCANKGIVQGDIDVGGVAGAMSIDEEDPEENAAGSVELSLGSTYLTKCILEGCKNYGYITAKKDGAGCVAGYMNLGIAVNCEAYGGAESKEGDYVGGICGQSLAMIQKCYSLCTLSGGKYVGGIAGYGDAINNCCAMADVEAKAGRAGAIAGQAASRESDELLKNIKDNYYVGDELYGIDNISYLGVAEPVTYEELLTVESLPVDYRHLKVTFVADDKLLGTQEVKYGESLSGLQFPSLSDIDDTNGVWPDVSNRKMQGNLMLVAEYEENITVLESVERKTVSAAALDEDEKPGKSIAFAEGEFTGKAVLHAAENDKDTPPHTVTQGKDYTVYDIMLENADQDYAGEIPLRLLNERGGKAAVWEYIDGSWEKKDTKVRGQYLQLTMQGTEGTFCMVYEDSSKMLPWIIAGAAGVLVMLLLVLAGKKLKGKKKNSNH